MHDRATWKRLNRKSRWLVRYVRVPLPAIQRNDRHMQRGYYEIYHPWHGHFFVFSPDYAAIERLVVAYDAYAIATGLGRLDRAYPAREPNQSPRTMARAAKRWRERNS